MTLPHAQPAHSAPTLTEPAARASALTGVRVLDLSIGTAGELAAMLLADYGADVVRIEAAPAYSDPGSPMWQRNKRIVQAEAGGAYAESMLASADIVVTTNAASAALVDRLIAAGSVDSLIHLALTRFRVDESVPSRPADGLMSAATGIARRQSSYDGGPVESAFVFNTLEQGLWGATCAVAALLQRERSGRGQRVTVDGMHAALITSAATMVIDPDIAPPSTAVGPHGPNPVYSTYRCGDGAWLLLGALLPKFQQQAFALLGVSDILCDPRIAGDNTKLYAVKNRGWVRERMAAGFLTRPRDEWLQALADADCPASVVAGPLEFLDHPQVLALGLRRSVQDPLVGHTEMPWVPADLTGTPAIEPVARSYVSDAQWHARRNTRSPTPTPTNSDAVGPLSGWQVLDLGAVLAGPFAGSLLAELGAEVIKIEPSVGDAFRTTGWHFNRGQRSLAVDLRSSAGHAAFMQVVAGSDAVIDNFRPGVLKRLSADYEALTRVRPDIVTASITGFGETGPMAGAPGFDPILQAASGMMSVQGGDGDPVFSSIAVNDVSAACSTALGICLALYHRARTGVGQRLSISLTGVSLFMQSDKLVRFDGRKPVEVGGRDYQGASPLDRLYPTADGYVRIHLPDVAGLVDTGMLDAATAAQDADRELAERIGLALRDLDTAEVIKRIDESGGAATAAVRFLDLIGDPAILAAGYFHEIVRPDGKSFFAPGRYAHFSASTSSQIMRAPGLGEHSRTILQHAGLDNASIDDLIGSSAIYAGGPLEDFGVAIYR